MPPLSRPVLLSLALLGAASSASPALAQAPALRDSLLVSPAWLAARLGDPGVSIVQVDRDTAGYAEGHLPGARFLPLSAILTARNGIPNELPDTAVLVPALERAGLGGSGRIVIYGDPLAAARLFFTLDYLGAGDRAALLDGGLAAWKGAGGAVTEAAPAAGATPLVVRLRPEIVVDADWVRDRLGDSGVTLLDARPPSDYAGLSGSEGLPRAGHIPGAQSLFWRLTLTSPEPRFVKPPEILRALFRRGGAVPGRTVVTYCRTGVQASFLYFVARYLGYAPRMYDGSFSDWSRRMELPVAVDGGEGRGER